MKKSKTLKEEDSLREPPAQDLAPLIQTGTGWQQTAAASCSTVNVWKIAQVMRRCHPRNFHQISRAKEIEDHSSGKGERSPSNLGWNSAWRRGRDLNPRYPLRYVRFRGGSFQPLTHLSAP